MSKLKADPLRAPLDPVLANLRLPGGRAVHELDNASICRIARHAGVPDVTHDKGREDNLRAFAAHLDQVAQDGALNAVNAWLAKHG